MEPDLSEHLADAMGWREKLHDEWVGATASLNIKASQAQHAADFSQLYLFDVSQADLYLVGYESGAPILSLVCRDFHPRAAEDDEVVLRHGLATAGLPWAYGHGELTWIADPESPGGPPVGMLRVVRSGSSEKGRTCSGGEDIQFRELGHDLVTLRRQLGLWQRIAEADQRIASLEREEQTQRNSHQLRRFGPLGEQICGGFLFHTIRGKAYPPFISRNTPDRMRATWDSASNDVFICTHQKVGTHLGKRFLLSLVRELAPLPADSVYATNDIGHGAIPWLEVIYSQHGRGAFERHLARTDGYPRLWYTHAASEDFPARQIDPASRFLVVLRDPKAVAVSQYFFWKRHPLLAVPASVTLDDFVDLFLQGDLYFGDYHQHVLGWISLAERLGEDRACVIRYEDMVTSKEEVMMKLSRFIAPGSSLDPGRCAELCRITEFDVMKEDISRDPRSFHLNPSVFFRSGKVDDWKNHLSPAAAARIDLKTAEVWMPETARHPVLDIYTARDCRRRTD